MTVGLDRFSTLPREIQVGIAEYLDLTSLSCLAQTSRGCYEVVHDGKLWRSLRLGNFVKDNVHRTVLQLFALNPELDPKINPTLANACISRINPQDATVFDWYVLLKLLKRGASFPENFDEKKAFLVAVKKNMPSLMTALFKSSSFPADFRNSVCITAAQNGHVETVKHSLKSGHINSATRDLALDASAGNGHVKVMTALLQDGPISVNGQDYALVKAAQKNQPDAMRVLLQLGPISKDGQNTALTVAARNDYVDVLDVLLKNCIFDIAAHGAALIEATKAGKAKAVQTLLHPDFITSDLSQCAALARAVSDVDINAIRLLLIHGSLSDENRQAILHHAIGKNQKEVARAFLQSSTMSPMGLKQALHFAVVQGTIEIVREFLQSVPPVHVEVMIYAAAEHGHADIVKELLKYGPGSNDSTLRSSTLKGSIEVAKKNGHTAVVEILLQKQEIDWYPTIAKVGLIAICVGYVFQIATNSFRK